MKKVIITGAGGFVGSVLTKKFIDNGIAVVAVSLAFNDEIFPESSLVTKIESEINAPEILKSSIPKGEYDAFYHLAWMGVNGPDKSNPVIQLDNIKVTINCAFVAKQLGCKKFLCSGTIAEQSIKSLFKLEKTSDGMIYGIAKYCTHMMLETYCKNIGLDFVWMQFSNIYGPKNKTGNLVSYTMHNLLIGDEAIFGPALQLYDFIYIDDLIEAVYRLGLYKTRQNFYFIGSGEPKILKDYLTQMGEICGKPELIKIGARQDDGIVYDIDMFDISKLIDDIGNYNITSFSKGIASILNHY